MKCSICKTGNTIQGITTVALTRGNTVVVIRDVPALICEDCGEYYLSEEVAKKTYRLADDAVARHAEVEVIHFAA